ncbi:hypothetical protein [Actinomycetospora aeridis]|uniref:Head-to-tail adaptor n=1 Tax=Actinomycetospora aeridis TaxID=3129231 RepID=A0ABU8N2F9_9PSEU
MTVWATTEYLATYLGEAVPDDAGRLLARASRVVDGLITHAVYDTDDDGQPTSLLVRGALADATCAQVQTWIDAGQATYEGDDDAGSEAELAQLRAAGATSVSFGALSIGLSSRSSATASTAVTSGEDWSTASDETIAVLRRAGLRPARISLR